jgi:hypothetical protein
VARKLTPVKVPAAEPAYFVVRLPTRTALAWPKANCAVVITSVAIRHEASVNNEFTIFTGTANPALAGTIARELGTQVGACVVDRYPDGDVAVQLLDSVRRTGGQAEWQAGADHGAGGCRSSASRWH